LIGGLQARDEVHTIPRKGGDRPGAGGMIQIAGGGSIHMAARLGGRLESGLIVAGASAQQQRDGEEGEEPFHEFVD
jgi:hypothetical protein